MTLDYIIAAETAFFSDDQRLNIIKIFQKIVITLLNPEKESTASFPVLPNFSAAGKVSGDYGNGVRIEIVHESGEIMLKNTLLEATEKDKEFFNFVLIVNNLILKEGKYYAEIKDHAGKKIIGKEILIEVIRK